MELKLGADLNEIDSIYYFNIYISQCVFDIAKA